MALTLNHFSIRSSDLDACERFYVGVLGLTVGPRPDFPFPGLWIYRGDHADPANAVVHIIGKDKAAPAGLDNYLGERNEASLQGSGAVDHIAFSPMAWPRCGRIWRPTRSPTATASCPPSACSRSSSPTPAAW